MKTATGALSTLTFALVLSVALPSGAQERVGVVTTVVGPVTVARASLSPEPLKFKDDVFVRDRVTTGENAFTRILLGGKVVITARERSTLTITETPDLSTIDLASGRIAVAVEKSRMKPAERVDIRTPNAVAGVRGTVLIVEAAPNVSTVTVLRGLVHVTRLNPVTGDAVGAYTAVGAREAVTVRHDVLPTRSQRIAPSRAEQLSREFAAPLQAVTSTAALHGADEIERALAQSDVPAGERNVEWSAVRPAPFMGGTAISAALPWPVGAPAPALTAMPAAPPVLATPPTLVPSPVVPSTPVVPAPAPSISTSSKYGSSYKSDRSGSNSGRH